MGREVIADGHWLPQLPALYFRGCDLTAEWLLAKEHVRVRFPATAPILIRRAPACATESPKLSLLGAAPRRRANFPGVVADKQCTCLASKLMRERYPPIPPAFAKASAWRANLNGGENEIQASLISSASVGATPTPATNIYGK